jgi:hypothetical protein
MIDFAEGIAQPSNPSVIHRVEFYSILGHWVLDRQFKDWADAKSLYDQWTETDRPVRIVSIHTRTTRSLDAYHDPAGVDTSRSSR